MEAFDPEISRLRHQRNLASWFAAAMIAGSVAAVLPGAIKSYRQLQAADDELLRLQQSIVTCQQQTRDAQAEIIRVQDRISVLLHPRR